MGDAGCLVWLSSEVEVGARVVYRHVQVGDGGCEWVGGHGCFYW